MHYGILGMRWGVRRYQNYDGSLTPAGEKRYNSIKEAKTEQIKQETAGEYKRFKVNLNEYAQFTGDEMEAFLNSDTSNTENNAKRYQFYSQMRGPFHVDPVFKKCIIENQKQSIDNHVETLDDYMTAFEKKAPDAAIDDLRKWISNNPKLTLDDVLESDYNWFDVLGSLENNDASFSKIQSEAYNAKQELIKACTKELRAYIGDSRYKPSNYEFEDLIEDIERERLGYDEYDKLSDIYNTTIINKFKEEFDGLDKSAQHSDDSLQHYGVLGMRWGIRRYQNEDGTLTAAGKKHRKELAVVQSNSNISVRDAKTQQIKQETAKENSAAALGMVVGAQALAITSILVADSIQRSNAISRDKKAEKRISQAPRDPKTGLPLKEQPSSIKDDMKAVNPSRGSGEATSLANCGYCTLAYDMRRRGYDVLAKKAVDGTNPDEFYSKYYKNAKVNYVEPDGYKEMLQTYKGRPDLMLMDRQNSNCQKAIIRQAESEMLSQGEGARGYFGVTWAGALAAHSMAYEVSGGKVNIIDAQSATKKDISEFTPLISQCRYARLDNAEPNYEQIKKDGVRS